MGDDDPISVTLLKTSSGWQLTRGGEPYEICGVGWGQPSSPYDLDGNGIVNGADLAIILVGWGLCP